MEAKSQNLQLNELRAVTREYVSSSQAYMKRELNKYRAQSTKMVSLSAEIKAANQNITEMKSAVRSLNGKVRAKKLKADEELERKLDNQKQLLKDVKLKHEKTVKELQDKINDQKQLVKGVKEEKKKLMELCKNRMKGLEQEKEVWKADTAASLAVKQLHSEELLELEKSKMKDKNLDLNRLRNEKALVEKTLGAERTAKDRLLKQVHSLKERATKRKAGETDPMEKIRYDQMKSNIRQQEHQSRLEMNAAANSRKHAVNGKARSRAMESMQPLLQTMASGGGCHGGGHKNGAWNAGGVITALRNDNIYGGPLPPPVNAPFQMDPNNYQQSSLPTSIQQTYQQMPHMPQMQYQQQYQQYQQQPLQQYQP